MNNKNAYLNVAFLNFILNYLVFNLMLCNENNYNLDCSYLLINSFEICLHPVLFVLLKINLIDRTHKLISQKYCKEKIFVSSYQ